MSVTVSVTKIVADGQDLSVFFNLPKTGNYVTAAGGDTVDFTKAIQDALFQGMALDVLAGATPVSLEIWDVSGNLATGVVTTLGTLQTNSKVQLLTAYNTELGSGAYPNPMKLQGVAVFHKNV